MKKAVALAPPSTIMSDFVNLKPDIKDSISKFSARILNKYAEDNGVLNGLFKFSLKGGHIAVPYDQNPGSLISHGVPIMKILR